jgi:predicted phage terminase large subunit-like protein
MVRWEIEPASAGKRENVNLIQILAGLDAKGVRPQGDKLTRALPLARQAEAGNVKLLRGPWNERLLTHLHHQPDIKEKDIMDASSGAFTALTATGWARGAAR